MRLYLDTETVGLHGLAVLIQYAYEDGPVQLWDVWKHPITETLDLLEEFVKHDWIMFNAAFDAFHLIKLYTTFCLVEDKESLPLNIIPEIRDCEERARLIDVCYKPKSCCDLMLLARKGKYQNLMRREPIRIRRIPTRLSYELAKELESHVVLDDIYFAKAKDKSGPRWKIYDIKDHDGVVIPDFKDIVLSFKASGSLKNLARHALNIPAPILFHDIEVDRQYWPTELGYAPYANAVYRGLKEFPHLFSEADHNKRGPWPEVILDHAIHWEYNLKAREYACDDVTYTRRLHLEIFGAVHGGDNDSTLACMVAGCRWHGYSVDLEKIKKLKIAARLKVAKTPTAPKQAKNYIMAVMEEIDKLGIRGSTKKTILEEIAKTWRNEDGSLHPAAVRSQEVLDARQAIKEIEIYDKLLLAGRFHASFIVVGTLSSRMAGSDGLNPQGIKHDKYVREAFTLCDPSDNDRVLCGGDFKSFEVSIACTVFDDPDLTATIKSGFKIHAIMAQELYPKYTYEEILKSDGNGSLFPEGDMYDTGKKCIFSKIYFGDEHTWLKKMGVPLEVGGPANLRLMAKYKGIKRSQDKVVADFGALRQPGGIGTRVEWHKPAGYAESFLGFRRFFTLEQQIAKVLFDLAEKPPTAWSKIKARVARRIERIQTVGGAVRSALYGAAFAIVSGIIRAAGNHYVQSPGAEITKAVQRKLWDLQPVGIGPWIVQPMNIHDELMCPTRKGYELIVQDTAQAAVAEYQDRVPLLAIDWFIGISNWASKKGVKVYDKTVEPLEVLLNREIV